MEAGRVAAVVLLAWLAAAAVADECTMNEQLEGHLTQLLQDLRVLVDGFAGCSSLQPKCQQFEAGSALTTTGRLRLIPVEHHSSSEGTYKLTWEEANAICDKLGHTMATTAQLQDAWSKGYDKCACGWLADGSVKYPITNVRPGCGAHPGLTPCANPKDGWDVYCSKLPIPVEHHTSPAGWYKLASWEEAAAECAKYGLVLATRDQLQAAWLIGYDKCSCGWLADGTVSYPVTNPRKGCGGTSDGLIGCAWDAVGWNVYCSKAKVPVEHHRSHVGTYKLATWEDGKAECAKYGLTMATTPHLQAAVEAGYDKCACGWLADGSVKYPVTRARPGCGGTSSSLISCGSDPSAAGRDGWDVYCYVGY